MKSYKSYNRKSKRGSAPLWILLASVLLLLFLEGRSLFPRDQDLTDEVKQEAELSGQPEIVRTENPEGVLEVHFLDVGHGDSTLILCGEQAMMIDCGDSTQGESLQSYLRNQGVTGLDYLVLTHPDKDHIGGSPAVLTEFPVGQVFQSDYKKGSEEEEYLQRTLAYKQIDAVVPEVGEEYQLGEAWFTILGPVGRYEESNDCSIALLLHFGENTFLFTGDAEKDAEKDMLENSEKPGLSLKADVYQVGHHGSKSSTKKKFLSAVAPEYAVISCDYRGEKGNPDAEVLERLREADVKVFRTDEQGSVTAFSDGKNITWSCEPSESFAPGGDDAG